MTRYLLIELYTTDNDVHFGEPQFAQITLDEEATDRLVTLIGAADEVQKNLQCQAIDGFGHMVVYNDCDPAIEIDLLFDEGHGAILDKAEAEYLFLDEPVEDENPLSPSFVVELHIFPSSFCLVVYHDGIRYDSKCGVDIEELEGLAEGSNV